MKMSERIITLTEYSEYVFERLDRILENLTEKEVDWRPTDESNDIRWILNHISRLLNVIIMIYIKGEPDFVPEGWPSDYNQHRYDLERYLSDIKKGKEKMLEALKSLTPKQLKGEVTRRGRTRTRQLGIFVMLSEIIHHAGQIAYLKGTINRRREKDPTFLC
jgi:hypothetical protein